MISIIAAIGRNNELGKGNTLLWKLPADMEHFKKITSLHSVIMGRKTFESLGRSPTGEPIGKPLPNRRNIVITRDADYKKEGVKVAHSLSEALDVIGNNNEEIFIIGGGELYAQTMPIADRLYITHVGAEDKSADTFSRKLFQLFGRKYPMKSTKEMRKIILITLFQSTKDFKNLREF